MNTDVVISTRIRLARNFAGYNFPVVISGTSYEQEITDTCTSVLNRLGGYTTYYMTALSEEEKHSLAERYIISSLLAKKDSGAVAVSKDGLLSVMINEEDHIREQCMVKGLDFEGCYTRISNLDKVLAANCRFASHNNFYYTACPTNLGTGMRASLMVFLPALTRSGRIEEISRRALKNGITIRGAFGEGSFADGYYYQISNSVTMGDPKQLISKVRDFALTICDEENDLRNEEYEANVSLIKDRSLRALGVLTHCVILPYDEFCELMSQLKLGISYGFISCNRGTAIDDLTVTARTYTLLLNSAGLKGNNENEKRASYVKAALKVLNCAEII